MQKFGIDVSHWQGNFDFKKAKETEGIEFAILKAGGSDEKPEKGKWYKDAEFESYYSKCKALGIPVGAYYFGGDLTIEDAKKSANLFLSYLKGKQFEYPVYYDVEGAMIAETNPKELTEIVLTFVDIIEKAGYWAGIYSSASFFDSEMEDKRLSKYAHWAADWHNKPVLRSGNDYGIWQFGGSTNCIRTTKINGQTVDQDYCYIDYPTMIKERGLNGFTKPVTPAPTPMPKPSPVPSKTIYRVQVGAFSIKENAIKRAKELKSKGFSIVIKYVNGQYKPQVGAYEVRKNAEAMLEQVKASGYEAFITTQDGPEISF